jgi:hypothetical protein
MKKAGEGTAAVRDSSISGMLMEALQPDRGLGRWADHPD